MNQLEMWDELWVYEFTGQYHVKKKKKNRAYNESKLSAIISNYI